MAKDSEGILFDISRSYAKVLIFAAGVIISTIIFFLIRDWERSELQSTFEISASKHYATLQKDLIRHQEIVNSVSGLLSTSSYVSRKEFQTFVKDSLAAHKNIQALSWNPLVRHDELQEYIEKARQDGFDNFQVSGLNSEGKKVISEKRDDYILVYYIEPYEGNEAALGFNIASHPGRMAAINKARDIGQPVITERIKLVQEKEESFGYLLFKAVYKKGAVIDNLEKRRENFIGLAVGVFRFKDWVSAAFSNSPPYGIDILLMDLSAEADKQFLHFHSSRSRETEFQPIREGINKATEGIHWQTTFNMLGRQWSFLFTPAPKFYQHHRQGWAWLFLVSGLLITGLLTYYLHKTGLYTAHINRMNRQLLDEMTERYKKEIQLQANEKLLRSVADNYPNSYVSIIEKDYTVGFTSGQEFKKQNIDPEQFVGKSLETIFNGQTDIVHQYYDRTFAGEECVFPLFINNQHQLYRTVPLYNDQGDIDRILSVAENITESKQLKHALEQIEERYRILIDSVPDWIWEVNEQAVYTYASFKVHMLGYEENEVLGKSLTDFMPAQEQQRMAKVLEDIFTHRRPFYNLEHQFTHKDGRTLILETSGEPIFAEESDFKGYRGVTRDVTEKKMLESEHARMQKELLQSQRMESLGQLAGGIAHDFNNLLGIITGYADFILNTQLKDSDDKINDYVLQIKTAGDRASNLVKQLLIFSRSENEKSIKVQLGDLLEETGTVIRASLPSTIELNIDKSPDVPSVLINPVQLHQILINLASNARDAMDGSGRLTIQLKFTRNLDCISSVSNKPVLGDWVELSVTDTGLGMDDALIDNIFNPFFTTKDVGRGTGLGLSVVYGIMEKCGGHILIDSVLGEGTTFRLLFPPQANGNQLTADNNQTEPAISPAVGKQIMVVDDEKMLGNFLTELLEDNGYQCSYFENAVEALDCIKQEPERYSMLITDQTMPKMTGLDLILELKVLLPELPMILCSGYSDKIEAEKAEEIGVSFFTKPVDSKELLTRVAKLLSEK